VSKEEDNSAFPLHLHGDYGKGMTLRDYFAAAALQGVICHNGCGALTDEDSSRIAYEYADEMIKARKGGDQP
jgi:hypothetical protein